VSRPVADAPLPGLNGDAPVINLDDVMGPRVAVRKVVLAGNTYRFRPLNLTTAKLLSEDKPEEAFRSLILEDVEVVDRFLADAPAAYLDEILKLVYSEQVLGEATPRPPSSSRAAGKSKPSKRTSPSGESPSASS
jgi:hypothetical protein